MPTLDDDRPLVRKLIGGAFVLVSIALIGVLVFAWAASHRATDLKHTVDSNANRIDQLETRNDQLEDELKAHNIAVPSPPTTTTTTVPRRSTTTERNRAQPAATTTSTTTTTRPSTTTTTTTRPACTIRAPGICIGGDT